MCDTHTTEQAAQLILLRSTLMIDKYYSWCANCNHGNVPPYGIQIDTKETNVCDNCGTRWIYSASTYRYDSLEATKRQMQASGVRPTLIYIGTGSANYDWTEDKNPYAVFDELYL